MRMIHTRTQAPFALLALVAALSLTACSTGGAAQLTAAPAQPAARPTVVTAAEIEQRFGVQPTLVAVTAAGGLLDIRLRVTDAAKAAALFTAEHLPAVIDAKTGAVIRPAETPEAQTLTDGQVYFLLYPNTGGAVKPGSTIILAFGDVGVEVQTPK